MYNLASLIDFVRNTAAAAPHLELLTLSQILLFLRLAIELRKEILLVQPSDHPVDVAPVHLSPSIHTFLSKACSLSSIEVLSLWAELKDTIWTAEDDPLLECIRDTQAFETLFTKYGQLSGFTSSRTIWPEAKTCTHSACKFSTNASALKLHTVTQRHAILLTKGDGPVPVWAVYFTCNGCKTQYHPNYIVRDGIRIYDATISDRLQVEDHVFVERSLAEQWRLDMNVGWISATNCMNIYLRQYRGVKLPEAWKMSLSLSHRTVGETFLLYALWLDCCRRDISFSLPHTGNQRDRFQDAMQQRNYHIKTTGQPEKRHRCALCVRDFPPEKPGDFYKTTAVVVCDGKAMGCPCCHVGNCQERLQSVKDRFCRTHTALENVCCVTTCSAAVRVGFQTCDNPHHVELERRYKAKGDAAFQLTERLKRAGMSHLDSSQPIPAPVPLNHDDSIPSMLPLDEYDDDDDDDEEDDDGEDSDSGRPKSYKPAQLKAMFGRKRSHNEQLLIAPCGMIIARETFYNSESLPSVAQFFRQTYWDGFAPDHLVFDNNCGLSKHVRGDRTGQYKVFDKVGLTVDVFHFKCKHKESDTYCQEHCNPAAFPELMNSDGKGWWFNTSVAEQTNAWLGGYLSMCREMSRDVFTFFLDEMILIRNMETKRTLDRNGAFPTYWRPGDK